MKYTPQHLVRFAQDILGKPLYPYQYEAAEAILESIFSEQGHIITVMMARQSGKNQLSAVLEAFLLSCMQQGTIVKAAPTFTPQIINSRLRLLSMLDTQYTRDRLWTSNGYIVGLAPGAEPALLHAHAGPRVMFYSAGTESNVVGATADLLLEIDEAQDVAPDKFDRDFRPMAAVRNATTVLYGTAWSDATLLARQRANNLESEQRTGKKLHFEYDWRTLAAINPAYHTFVEKEIARLGEDHLAIQTQYYLRPISGAGYFLNALQRSLLRGSHDWQDAPRSGDWYIAGMDVAGEERPVQVGADALYDGETRSHKRDSTVISIGRVTHNELNLPAIEVVHQQWWTGMPYLEQYAAAAALVEQWNVRTLVVDATGLGAGMVSLLANRYGGERIMPFTFTRASKSRLAYHLLALINSGRFKLCQEEAAPRAITAECWQQLKMARCRLPAPEILDMYVDPRDGHDDFLISLALLAGGIATLSLPAASTLIRPRRLFGPEGRF